MVRRFPLPQLRGLTASLTASLAASLAAIVLCSWSFPAAATFSIAAVDEETGQVGSAGASCIAGSIILSDVHPGVGVVHTQAYWNSQNQQYARLLMDLGYAPQAIIDSVVAHDAQGNPTIRQYGVVDLQEGGRSAGYTGVNCTNYRGHLLGPNYAIQGNILLGPEILEDMEQAFLDTPGTLADRLMAALQAAKVPGADTRCRQQGKSSISAFLRVARPTDQNELFLDLNVNTTPSDTDPIDVLQGLYDQWRVADAPPPAAPGGALRLHAANPNPFRGGTVISYEIPAAGPTRLGIYDVRGSLVATLTDGARAAGSHQVVWGGPRSAPPSGVYFCRLEFAGEVRSVKILRLTD